MGDYSGDMWITMFSPEVEKILEMTADQVGTAAETDSSALADIVQKASFKQYVMKCYNKLETFQVSCITLNTGLV